MLEPTAGCSAARCGAAALAVLPQTRHHHHPSFHLDQLLPASLVLPLHCTLCFSLMTCASAQNKGAASSLRVCLSLSLSLCLCVWKQQSKNTRQQTARAKQVQDQSVCDLQKSSLNFLYFPKTESLPLVTAFVWFGLVCDGVLLFNWRRASAGRSEHKHCVSSQHKTRFGIVPLCCLCVSVSLCLCVSVSLCLCVSVSLDRMFLLPSDRIFLLLASQIGSQTPAQLRPTSSSQPNAPQKQVTKSQILSKRQEVCLQALHCIHSQSSLLCHSVDPSLPAPFPPLLLFPPPLLLLLLFFSLFFSFFHLWPPFSFGKQHPHMVGERRCGRRSRLPVRLMTWPW